MMEIVRLEFIFAVIYHLIQKSWASKLITAYPTFGLNKTSHWNVTEKVPLSNRTFAIQSTSVLQTQQLIKSSIKYFMDIKPSTFVNVSSYTTSQHFSSTPQSVLSTINSSVVTTQCHNCNETQSGSDKEYLYIFLGIGIGSVVFIFIIVLLVTITKRIIDRWKSERRNNSIHTRDGDDFLWSKESIFSSSTLQLHGGLSNAGLELDSFQSPSDSPEQQQIESTQRKKVVDCEEVESETVYLENNEIISTAAQHQSENELEFHASIRLLQDWNDSLDDDTSDQYKELKLQVEQSVYYIYRTKAGFKGVKLEGFRKGSIIADLILIMLALVQDPFEIFEECIEKGKLGRLNIDKKYFVKRRTVDMLNVEKNQRILHEGKSQEYVNEELQIREDLELFDEPNPDSAYASRELSQKEVSNLQLHDDITHDSSMDLRTDVVGFDHDADVDGLDSTKRKSSVDVSSHHENDFLERETNLKGRQHSLADLRNINLPVRLRDQRDSGIGSMQELSASEIRLSKASEKLEDSEKVFVEHQEKISDSVQQLGQIDEDVPHVALLDFLGENDHELSIKQGDILHVINRGLSGWLKVIDSEYKSGWVPESFLVHVSQSQLSDTQQTVETLQFFDDILDELENESESTSSAASTPETEECMECEQRDLTDASNKTIIERDSDIETVEKKIEIQVKRCKSVYRFDGKDSSELSFKVGEIIDVHKISDVGWWKGELNGLHGWFPSSYVMPLNEESEVQVSSAIMPDHDHIISGKFRGSDRSLCLSREADINKQRKSHIRRHEHRYQSLQRSARKKEEYAHLYFQILKRESKSDENIPGLFKSASFSLINTTNVPSQDWPCRAPPALPKDAEMNKKARPPPSSYSEPPNRPAPRPPTRMPSLAKMAVLQPKRSSESFLIAKDLKSNILPRSRSKHEHLPATQNTRALRLEENYLTDEGNRKCEANT